VARVPVSEIIGRCFRCVRIRVDLLTAMADVAAGWRKNVSLDENLSTVETLLDIGWKFARQRRYWWVYNNLWYFSSCRLYTHAHTHTHIYIHTWDRVRFYVIFVPLYINFPKPDHGVFSAAKYQSILRTPVVVPSVVSSLELRGGIAFFLFAL